MEEKTESDININSMETAQKVDIEKSIDGHPCTTTDDISIIEVSKNFKLIK